MAFRIGKAGPLVLVAIAAYVAVNVLQTRAAASLCARYSVGTPLKNVNDLEGTFFLTPMGHYDPNNPASQNVIFCAATTMCDVSCSLEIENGVVKKSEHHSL